MDNHAYDDPVYVHSRREAVWILVLWAIGFLWTVPCCYLLGYRSGAESIPLIWGMPAWVVWGVVVPWIACGAASVVLCAFFMQDDDLGRADDEVSEP